MGAGPQRPECLSRMIGKSPNAWAYRGWNQSDKQGVVTYINHLEAVDLNQRYLLMKLKDRIKEREAEIERLKAGYPNRWGDVPELDGSPCGSCGHNTDGDIMNSDRCADVGCDGSFKAWIPPPAEDPQFESLGACYHPDNTSKQCHHECNHFDHETDEVGDGDCRWHTAPAEEPEKEDSA